MKKKKILVFLMLLVIIPLTGCTQYIKKDDKQIASNSKTGQKLVSNILCKPTDKEILNLYKENNLDLSKLPECREFRISSNGYEGLWTTIFVKPLAFIIIKVTQLVGNGGLAVILITLLIRALLFPITNKTALQSENMKYAKPEIDKIEKKYANKTSQEDVMAKSQEMMQLYKKYKINPLAGCIFAVIQIPLFFAFYESMNRLPMIFEGSFLGLELGMSPLTALSLGKWYYLIIVLLVIAATYFSFKLNKTITSSDTQTQGMNMKMMTNISIVMISIASFSISTSIGLYWITNSGFTIIQNLLVKRGKKDVKCA